MSQTHGSPPSTPRWVKVFGIIAIALVLLFVILHLTGNSLGGPGGHTPLGSDLGGHTPPGGAGDTPSSDAAGHTPSMEHGLPQP